MRRGSRGLVPTILAAEAAIIGLLFLGQFTLPPTSPAPSSLADVEPLSAPPPGGGASPFTLPAVVIETAAAPAATAPPADPAKSASTLASADIAGALAPPGPPPAAAPASPASPTTTPHPSVDARAAASIASAEDTPPPPAPSPSPPAAIDRQFWLSDDWQSALWSDRVIAAVDWPVHPPRTTDAGLGGPDGMAGDVARNTAEMRAPAAASARPVPAPPVPSRRPPPPPVTRVVAVAAPPSPAPTAATTFARAQGTVTIEGRVFGCSALPSRLQARFASCGGTPETTVGTVDINGTTVACDRLTPALRERFPGCGG